MTPIEKQIISERVKASTSDEQTIIIKCLPTRLIEEELKRRNVEAVNVLNNLISVISYISEDMSLLEMQNTIKNIKDIVSGRFKNVKEIQNEIDN